ncbi:hypothetical protein IGA_04816 [Bacillus cereus HuA3-9]|uniref:Uncharacterized protein n=1 Tax=Bacillus cereus HuA3-9 TaxID=1053205 RepID=R8CMH7_BACCE|nr:hypothetical protein IGA_04816 [Bacillus cereus HuA3-9]
MMKYHAISPSFYFLAIFFFHKSHPFLAMYISSMYIHSPTKKFSDTALFLYLMCINSQYKKIPPTTKLRFFVKKPYFNIRDFLLNYQFIINYSLPNIISISTI